MTTGVRSATLSAGVINVSGYAQLLIGPPSETYLIKGIYATNNDAAQQSLTVYLWGPAGGGGLNIPLGHADLPQLQPFSVTLWLPLMPGWRIGAAVSKANSIHFAITGSVLSGVAAGITFPFPVVQDAP